MVSLVSGQSGIKIYNGNNIRLSAVNIVDPLLYGIEISESSYVYIYKTTVYGAQSDGIRVSSNSHNVQIEESSSALYCRGYGINIAEASVVHTLVAGDTTLSKNTFGTINDAGTDSIIAQELWGGAQTIVVGIPKIESA